MKNNSILVVEPFSGNLAGAQKVTLNVIRSVEKKYDIQLIMRSKSSAIKAELEKINASKTFLPQEKLINKFFGTGNFSFSGLSFFDRLQLFTVIFIINFYILWQVVKLKPKYIYTYDPRGLLFCYLASFLTKSKLIWHSHSEISKNTKIFSFLLGGVYKVIVPSNKILSSLLPLRQDKRNDIHLIYNGFDFKPELKTGVFKSRLIFVGSLVPHKGLHNIIDAMIILKEKKYNFSLKVVGGFSGDNSNYMSYISSKINENKLDVDLLGWLDDPTPELLKSDITIFSSVVSQSYDFGYGMIQFSSSEALPTVAIETIAYGVPIVAVNTPGISEILSSPSDGVIISESLGEDIANKIIKISENYNFYKPDHQSLRSKFSLPKMSEQLGQLFI